MSKRRSDPKAIVLLGDQYGFRVSRRLALELVELGLGRKVRQGPLTVRFHGIELKRSTLFPGVFRQFFEEVARIKDLSLTGKPLNAESQAYRKLKELLRRVRWDQERRRDHTAAAGVSRTATGPAGQSREGPGSAVPGLCG